MKQSFTSYSEMVFIVRPINSWKLVFKVLSSEFYFHKPITVHLELYFCYCFIHFLLFVGQY